MSNWVVRFWDFVDERAIVRRLMALGTFGMVWRQLEWSYTFAQTSQRTGVEVAAIIAAVGVPLSAMMGYMFGAYSKSKAEEANGTT